MPKLNKKSIESKYLYTLPATLSELRQEIGKIQEVALLEDVWFADPFGDLIKLGTDSDLECLY